MIAAIPLAVCPVLPAARIYDGHLHHVPRSEKTCWWGTKNLPHYVQHCCWHKIPPKELLREGSKGPACHCFKPQDLLSDPQWPWSQEWPAFTFPLFLFLSPVPTLLYSHWKKA